MKSCSGLYREREVSPLSSISISCFIAFFFLTFLQIYFNKPSVLISLAGMLRPMDRNMPSLNSSLFAPCINSLHAAKHCVFFHCDHWCMEALHKAVSFLSYKVRTLVGFHPSIYSVASIPKENCSA